MTNRVQQLSDLLCRVNHLLTSDLTTILDAAREATRTDRRITDVLSAHGHSFASDDILTVLAANAIEDAILASDDGDDFMEYLTSRVGIYAPSVDGGKQSPL